MGVGWRRFRERLHQGSPLGGGDFQPTSNARCAAMLDEARSFLAQLRRCEGAIRRMAAANAEGLNTVQAVMSAPLPRPHEETAGGGAAAAHGAGLIGGEGFSAEAMGSAAADVSHKSEAEVLAPLQRWSGVYSQLGARFAELEGVRLEVDSRRRTVMELSQRVDGLRGKLGSKGSNAKHEAELEQSLRRLQHKEGKLQVAAQNYADQEQLLHRDLSTLLADASWLRHYAAAALRLQGNALLAAAEAFGPMPAAPSPPASKVAAPAPARPASPGSAFQGARDAGRGGTAAAGSLPRTAASELGDGSPATPSAKPLPPHTARFPAAEARQGKHVDATAFV